MFSQFAILLPEILLATVALVMQVVAVCCSCNRSVAKITIIFTCFVAGFTGYFGEEAFGFGHSYIVNPVISLVKALVLCLSIMSLVIYLDTCKIDKKEVKSEFISLVLLSTLGIFISISARDFVILFCGLELQALSGYALAAFNNEDIKSSEAGLKYFILGALMSCVMLFGVSFLYGYTGSVNFIKIAEVVSSSEYNIAIIFGVVMMMSAILFKMSAAPLHIWTPDVYEGAPAPAVSFFAVAQKLGMLVVLINLVSFYVGDHTKILPASTLKMLAIFSMVIGALGALMQESLKRLMAYSSILNIGYVLIGLALGTLKGYYAAFLYMVIYAAGVMAFFACGAALFGAKFDEAKFDDLRGIALERKTLAAIMSVVMFSFVGIPPFAGFFGKFYLFYEAVKGGEIVLALVGVLTSVIAAFYYLKVVKYMYFTDAVDKIRIIPTQKGLLTVTAINAGFVTFFFIFASYYIFN